MRRLLLALALLTAPLAPLHAQPPAVVTRAGNPFQTLPKQCWPDRMLVGKDTLYGLIPCNSIDVLPPKMRAAIVCTLDRMRLGGWDATIFEVWRSDRRQQFLYSYGRTRPGPRVTNAKDAYTSVHYYFLAVDIISRKKGWDHPRFFYWLGQHAESCGLVAGVFWKSFPDGPHVQWGQWMGAPPQWARQLVKLDSIGIIHQRVGAL